MSEPVAWMWQHEETGMTGFIEACDEETRKRWEHMNRPRKIVAPLYASSYAMGVADAARVVGKGTGNNALYEAIRALSSPPSVTEEWVKQEAVTQGYGESPHECEDIIRATLAALNIEVTK